MKRVNEESKDTFKKVSEKKGMIETERVIHSEDGSTKMEVVKEQFVPKENQLMQKILTQIIKKGLQVTKDVKLKKFRMFLNIFKCVLKVLAFEDA
jgi:hypothetical protein